MNDSEIIFSLVEKHFHLDAPSLGYFKHRIFNYEIPEFYRNYFKDSPDLRKHFPLINNDRERFDPGWRAFQDFFPNLVINTGLNYDEFKDNKKTVEKNSIKLKKFIIDYYTENKDEMLRDFSFPKSIIRDSSFSGYLDETVANKLELIGQKKLPNEELKIVVSNNFTDWFLCSTSETWSSCLNFRSEFSGAYWSGLPGLIGDINRTMVYITNGEEKEFYGLKAEKFINRTFGVLDVSDKVFLLKFYPLKEMFSPRIIQEITGMELTTNFSRSKYSIHMLWHDEPISKSCYVYQDETNFSFEGSKLYLVPGEREFYWMNKGSKSKHVKQFLHYKGGLPTLIDHGLNIAEVQPKCQCPNCGKRILFNEETRNYEGMEYCVECFDTMFDNCKHCGQRDLKKRMKKVSMSKYYCPSCYDVLFRVKCQMCGKVVSHRDSFLKGEEKICVSCALEKYSRTNSLSRCEECSVVHISNGKSLCEKCLKEKEERMADVPEEAAAVPEWRPPVRKKRSWRAAPICEIPAVAPMFNFVYEIPGEPQEAPHPVEERPNFNPYFKIRFQEPQEMPHPYLVEDEDNDDQAAF